MDEATPHLPPKLEYGRSFNRALCDRLERHFNGTPEAEGRGAALWWSACSANGEAEKPLHLQHIRQHLFARLDGRQSRYDTAPSLILPIFFNAWRYEAEPHLIVPLLKTTQYQLRQWSESKQTTAQQEWEWIRERAARLGDIAVALSYGFKGKLEAPFLGEMDFDSSSTTSILWKRRSATASKPTKRSCKKNASLPATCTPCAGSISRS